MFPLKLQEPFAEGQMSTDIETCLHGFMGRVFVSLAFRHQPQWGTADAEIKTPPLQPLMGAQGYQRFPLFKPGVRTKPYTTCFAYILPYKIMYLLVSWQLFLWQNNSLCKQRQSVVKGLTFQTRVVQIKTHTSKRLQYERFLFGQDKTVFVLYK